MAFKPRSKRPLFAAVILSAIYAYWAIDAPSSMGAGAYLIWTPIVFAIGWGLSWCIVALIPALRK